VFPIRTRVKKSIIYVQIEVK